MVSEQTDVTTTRGDEADRGREADTPTEIPPRGWKDVLVRTKIEAKQDRVTTLAAAVAFYALLALAPALIALISIYGLVADPTTIERQANDWLGAAPQEVRELLVTQLQSISDDTGTTIGIGVAIGLLVALWSASAGMAHLVLAVNVAYDEEETRGFVRRRGLALLLTLGAIVFVSAEGVETAADALVARGAVPVGRAAVEVRRLELGLGRYGIDWGETTNPLEAGLDRMLDYTKGCYVGQEVVAKATYIGHVNKRLVRLSWEGEPAAADTTLLGGKSPGRTAATRTARMPIGLPVNRRDGHRSGRVRTTAMRTEVPISKSS